MAAPNGLPKVPSHRLVSLIKSFSKKRILVIGDIMLDQFIRGKVSRLSPEAPVPIVRVHTEQSVPGGAGNVCNNIAALGAQVGVVSVIGSDGAGRELLSDLRALGINTGGIVSDPARPTTQKCRVIAEHQQVVRFDRETAVPMGRKVQDQILAAIEAQIGDSDGVILSDYGKGVLTPYILSKAIGAARKSDIPVTVDPKVEHFKRYRNVSCITPNTAEAFGGMHQPSKDEPGAVEGLGRKILSTLKASSVLITRGEKGMSLFENKSPVKITHIPAQAREVFDVTGAGDTVISVLTLALACGASLIEAAVLANVAAGIVVGKLGTATVTAKELEAALK